MNTVQAARTGTALKRAALYLRVSTDRQTKRDGSDREGYSLPAQREEATRKARQYLGAEVVAEFSDPGRTGGNPNRPGLQALLRRIRDKGDIDYVVVWKLARFSRYPKFDEEIEEEFIRRGVQLVSVVRRIINGYEVGTIDFDPDRADLIRWLFKAYASGIYSIAALAQEARTRA